MKIWKMALGLGVLASLSPAAAQDFPADGRTITMIVPSSAGGGTDTAARLVAPLMEEDLGTPIEIVNKPGASMQIGVTEAVGAKPDGYTLVWSVLPTAGSIYLDPERGATFGREDLQPIGNLYGSPFALSVLADSPYQTVQDVVEAAKANPGGIKGGTTGFMSTGHFANLEFQRAAGVELATVNFQGGAPQLTALLGGHIDVGFNSIGELLTHERAGTLRILAIMDDQPSDFVPDVPTLASQGIDAAPIGAHVGLSAPAGVPQEIVDRLTISLEQATEDQGVKDRMAEVGNNLMYMPPAEYAAFWDDVEAWLAPLIVIAKQQSQ
jgi:tripartite-type tricarboxylate transporter receptor subunit TctC